MRLFVLVLLLFAIPLIVFLFLNSEQRVNVNLGTEVHADVPLSTVVFGAVVVGAGLVGIVATIEGAAIRLANRRLRREVRKLETELIFLRTGAVPTAPPPAPVERKEHAPAMVAHQELPSAPVYDGDEFDPYRESD
jgi:uncharacterized integral membrane protein